VFALKSETALCLRKNKVLLIALAAIFGIGITWVFEELKRVYEERKAG
jgi:hypothetical protein